MDHEQKRKTVTHVPGQICYPCRRLVTRSAPGEGVAAGRLRKDSFDALTRLPLTPTLSRKGKGFWATG